MNGPADSNAGRCRRLRKRVSKDILPSASRNAQNAVGGSDRWGDWDQRHHHGRGRCARVLTRWQRSGLTLREFGQRRGIPLSTLTWWRQAFRRDRSDIATSGLALFTRYELDRLRETPDELFHAVHAAKRVFPGSKLAD